MNARAAISLRTSVWSVCAALAMFAFGRPANASIVRINVSCTYAAGTFAGRSFDGYADLQIESDPKASSDFPVPTRPPVDSDPNGPLPPGVESLAHGTDRVDPPNAQIITGATGMFNGHAIVGVLPIAAQTDPAPGEYIPASRTTVATNGNPITYDNLFYASGSPLTCLWNYSDGTKAPKYPYAGGFLDVYGALFALDNDTYVDLWSNGVMPDSGLTYGVHLFAKDESGSYYVLGTQGVGVVATVPEPSHFWLFGAAVLGLFVWRRIRESRGERRAVRHAS
jgi:hypothetical protein